MASEHPNEKKEPPWVPVLPPMPRISVSSCSRARLSHRRPAALSSPSSALLSPASSPSSSCSGILPSPSSASPSGAAQEEGVSVRSWPASSACLDSAGSAPSEPADSVLIPVVEDAYSNDDSFMSRSSPCTASPVVPRKSDDCELGSGLDSYVSLPNSIEILSPPAPPVSLAALQHSSFRNDHHDPRENVMVLPLAVVDGVHNPEDLDLGNPRNNSCNSGDLEFVVADTASSPSRLKELRAASNCGAADITMNQESCSVIGSEIVMSGVVANGGFLVDEGELEEGQLPGEWSGVEEAHDDFESVQTCQDSAALPAVNEGTAINPKTLDVGDQVYYNPQIEEIYPDQRCRRNNNVKGKKKKKHKKGEGSKKRSREKSKDKYNEVRKKRRTEAKEVDDASNTRALRRGKGTIDRGEQTGDNSSIGKRKKVPDDASQIRANKSPVDEGPEDGEILLESTKTHNGILSSLVEAEVGLWTKDDIDDQFLNEMEEDGAVKKKRGPETAERKLKRKIAKRKKRAQKEREMGIRRPPRMVQSKPVKVLCTHYMKGRCTKGDQCTFSHDAVPLTKQEPCKFLMSNSCLKGDDCPYSHDLRAFPCKFFHTRGLCYDGENCQFSHESISAEALEKLQKRVEKEKKDRISSIPAVFDIPEPTFSIPLPPELDPDPLGWGTPSVYSSHKEGIEFSNPTVVDRSYGDFDLENRTGLPPLEGIDQSALLSSAMDIRGAKADAVSQRRMEEECEYLPSKNQDNGLEPGRSTDSKRFKMEAESFVPESTESPYTSTSTRILNLPVCSLLGERSNASDLAISMKEERVSTEQILQKECLMNDTHAELRPQGVQRASVSRVSLGPAKTFAGTLVRGRQLGSLLLEHEKTLHSPSSLVTPKRQHTVESLLDEALRH